jgi:hypothetical protein
MASTVRSRPNHYQALGLLPDASQDQIAGAFARAMGMFATRPMAVAAEIGAAFETLRDPVKRRAYDKAIGLVKEPEPRAWAIASAAPGRGGFFGMHAVATPGVAREPFVAAPRRREPDPPPQPEVSEEPDTGSFIASSLLEIAKPGAFDPSRLAPERPPRPPETAAGTIHREAQQPVLPRQEDSSREAEDRPFDWRRPALAVGAFVVAAGLLGALAGVSVRDDEQQQATPGTAPVTAAKAHRALVAPAAATSAPPVEATVQTTAPHPARSQAAAVRTKRAVRAKPAPTFAQDVADTLATQSASADAEPPAGTATEIPAAESSAPRPVAAAMPLPNSVIARTIERIGYSCGSVASATPAADASGVYEIRCTSGQSYRASPVGGRYHFRRMGKR